MLAHVLLHQRSRRGSMSGQTRTGNRPELILPTIAACSGVFTSLIGRSCILLNYRSFLAWCTPLTWITFAFLVAPRYVTYRRRTFNLEGEIIAQWSRTFDTSVRFRIQNQLECCGYFSPFLIDSHKYDGCDH
ncbi:hypothetical protein BYT27DRAFT_6553390 [Phlegmacium glaucopus]|nr:hypothetical protein BYT27DRAFT_6553390 [Phlegmacium glaucopus]